MKAKEKVGQGSVLRRLGDTRRSAAKSKKI